eukprot:TRINITY_DN814_c0_g1_i1.p1 TRINITY_DN814_c0_g1~~TRINITY_DN814_c0_g1_i1.p1  ORF type:complete len:619 (-),score=209.61 TRINITY_DN814_c0_g1_i1:131-1897(-)
MAIPSIFRKVIGTKGKRSSSSASASSSILSKNEVGEHQRNSSKIGELVIEEEKSKMTMEKKLSEKRFRRKSSKKERLQLAEGIENARINDEINEEISEDAEDYIFDDEELCEQDEEEENHFGFNFEEEKGAALPKDFACLSPEEIIEQQQKEISFISELFSLPSFTAAALLRHFAWKREVLIARFLESPEKTKEAAGVSQSDTYVDDSFVAVPLQGIEECFICGDEYPPEECFALGCGHRFCNDCWKQYLTMKINEGEASKIRCPYRGCNVIIDEMGVKKIVSEESYQKYLGFLTRSFVEHSQGRVKWCTQPNCGNAITADMITGTVVRCSCGHSFCFTCHRDSHAPISCEQVKDWEKKCKDDSETTHWKTVNTKECPKCDTPVEKNGGCNHMTCRQCFYEWCWICVRPWKGHNDYYSCDKPLKEEKKSGWSLFGSKSKKDKIKEREELRETNRKALERYLFYYGKYNQHSHSNDLEKQIRNRAHTRTAELQKDASTTNEVSYLIQGTEILLECRKVLKYSYVYAFYLAESGSEKELFEYLQQDLEKTTEQLSEILEGSSHRLKALNMIQLAKTRKDNLLSSVEQNNE